MSQVKPVAMSHVDFLPPTTGASSWVTPWFDATYMHTVSMTCAWLAGSGTTAGTLSMEATDDVAQSSLVFDPRIVFAQADLTFAAGTHVVPLTITTTHGTYPATANAAGNCIVILENPPRFVRMKWTQSSAGVASQFTVYLSARAI